MIYHKFTSGVFNITYSYANSSIDKLMDASKCIQDDTPFILTNDEDSDKSIQLPKRLICIDCNGKLFKFENKYQMNNKLGFDLMLYDDVKAVNIKKLRNVSIPSLKR